MEKFTKGPWHFDRGMYDVVPGDSCDIRDEGGEWIASVNTQFTSIENGEANARLIAAAPEMYELLKVLSEQEDGFNVLFPTMTEKINELLNRINDIK